MSAASKLLLRRGEARTKLGVSDEVFTKLVACRRLTPVFLTPGGRAFYKSTEVDALTKLQTPTPTLKSKTRS